MKFIKSVSLSIAISVALSGCALFTQDPKVVGQAIAKSYKEYVQCSDGYVDLQNSVFQDVSSQAWNDSVECNLAFAKALKKIGISDEFKADLQKVRASNADQVNIRQNLAEKVLDDPKWWDSKLKLGGYNIWLDYFSQSVSELRANVTKLLSDHGQGLQ